MERTRLRFIAPPSKRKKYLRGLGHAGAVALMLATGLDLNQGGKVAWVDTSTGRVPLWGSADHNAPLPDWIETAPIAVFATVFKVAGDTSFANPGNWNDANNRIEAIGHGGKGSVGSSSSRGGPGGGGGAYASRVNVPLLSNGDFPVTIAIGAAGSGAVPTVFNLAHSGRDVQAAIGTDASTTTAGSGGAVANCIPNSALSGGNGATAGGGSVRPGSSTTPGAGGGGSGGPNGAGSAGGAPTSTQGGSGGNADGGTVTGPAGKTGSANGATGNSGTEWDATHGCGTGGGGGGTTSGNLGGPGGNYGGGAAGNSGNSGTNQNGAAGLLIITWQIAGSATLASNGTVSVDATHKSPLASATLAAVGGLEATSYGIYYISGFETGGLGEIAYVDPNCAASVQNSVVRSGAYALQMSSAFVSGGVVFNYLNQIPKSVGRTYFYTDDATPATAPAILAEHISGATRFKVTLGSDGKLSVSDNQGIVTLSGTTTGTIVLQDNTWYRIEFAIDLAPGGHLKVWLDGGLELDATHSEDLRGTGTAGYAAWGTPSANCYWDDVRVDVGTLTPPGAGLVIARQGIAGTPTYNAWTKNGAANAYQCWSDTPFSAATNCSSSTSVATQTMAIASFSSTQTGHGTETITSVDTINACKVSAVGKGASTIALALRRRYGSTDYDSWSTVFANDGLCEDNDSAWLSSMGPRPCWVTTFANLNSMEAGVTKDAETVLLTIEDVWVSVEFASKSQSGSATLAGIANISVDAIKPSQFGSATLAGEATSSFATSHTPQGAATLAGSAANISVAASHASAASATLASNGTVSVDASHMPPLGAVSFSGIAAISVDAIHTPQTSATLAGQSGVSLNATHTPSATVNLSAVGGASLNVSHTPAVALALAGTGAINCDAIKSGPQTWTGEATFAGTAGFSVNATGGTFPVQIGNANNITSGQGFALSHNVIAGSTVIVFAGDLTDNGSINGCSDPQNGSYQRAILQVSSNTPPVAIFYKVNAKALTAGVDQISVTTEGAGYYATAIAMTGVIGSIQTAGDSVFNADHDTVTLAGLPSLGAFCVAAIQFDEDPGAFVETVFADNTDPATPFFHSGTDDAHNLTTVSFSPSWVTKRDFSIAMAGFLYGAAATGTLSGQGTINCSAVLIDTQAKGTEAGIGSVSINATHTPVASGGFAGVAALSVTALQIESASATLAGVGAVSNTPTIVTLAASGSLAGAGQTSFGASHSPTASGSLPGTGAISCDTTVLGKQFGSATLSAVATITLKNVTIMAASIPLAATGAVSLGPVTIRAAAASIGPYTGIGSLSVDALRQQKGSATLAGSGAVSCDAQKSGAQNANATLAATGSLSAVAIEAALASANLSGVATQQAAVSHTPSATAELDGAANLSATSRELEVDEATLAAVANVSVIAFTRQSAPASLAGQAGVACDAYRLVFAQASLAGDATVHADSQKGRDAVLAGEASLAVSGYVARITIAVAMTVSDRALYRATAKDAA